MLPQVAQRNLDVAFEHEIRVLGVKDEVRGERLAMCYESNATLRLIIALFSPDLSRIPSSAKHSI